MTSLLEPTPDLALFREVLAYIDSNPHEWNQRVYGHRRADGTTCGCMAYHALRLSGHYTDDDFHWYEDGELSHHVGEGMIDALAAGELGLTPYEADALFSGDNYRADLQEIFDRVQKRARQR